MKVSTQNAIKDCQVLIKEAQLYTGGFDGSWGPGTAGGLSKMIQDYAGRRLGNRSLVSAISQGSGDAGAEQGCKDLQRTLQSIKLYTGAIDGVLGKGSLGSLQVIFEDYRAANGTPVYDVAWSASVPAAFIARIKAWVKSMALNPSAVSWLMACMAFESGGTFSPSIQNAAGSQAFGLIQFMKPAASDLGTTLEALKAMTQMQQLEFVFKYFEFWARAGKTYTQLEDFYLTIFYPAAVGMKPDQVLFDSSNPKYLKSYTQNKGFDFDKDGSITIGEISSTVRNKYYAGMLPEKRVKVA